MPMVMRGGGTHETQGRKAGQNDGGHVPVPQNRSGVSAEGPGLRGLRMES